MNNYIKIIFLVLIFSQVSLAQNSYVKAGYSPKEKSVVIKWFEDKNRFDEGVIIYRKDNADNNWVKMNDKPLKRPAKLSEADAKKLDSSTVIYNFIINTPPTDKTEYENWEFTLILQSLLNNKFAEYAVLGYTDNKIEPGKVYSYKVSYLRSGSEMELGISNETGAETPVASVNNSLTLAQDKEKIFCNWNAEPDIFVSYNLYRDGKKINSEPIFVFEMEKKQAYLFSDSLTSNGTYNYSYTGLDGFENESSPSASVAITVESVSLPPRPENVHYDGNNKITLFWHFASANFKGFNVFRSEDAKTEFTKLNSSLLSATDTSYTDNTAELNKKYFYYISSDNGNGLVNHSSVIAAISSDYSKPVTPENLTAESDSICVKLNWSKSSSSNTMGYKVYRNIKGNESEFLLLTPLPLTETSYTDTLTKGALNDFYYKVVALNEKYMNSDYSAPVAVKLKDVVPPSVPIIIETSVENNTVIVTWQPQFEMDLAGYKIYRTEDTLAGFTELSSVTKEKNSFNDNTVAAGKTYFYKISSTDITGNISKQSEQYSVFYEAENIQAPQIKINLTYNKAENTINVTWENSASPVKGYFVIRKDNDEEYSFPVSEMLTAASFSDTQIEAPGKYSYSVKIIYDNDEVITTSEQLIETN